MKSLGLLLVIQRKTATFKNHWYQTFYSEAIMKVKEASMRFKNISPSKALFKNEINNEYTPAPFYINPSFTDWVQNVPRCGIFLNTSHLYRVTILPIFLFVHWSPTDIK